MGQGDTVGRQTGSLAWRLARGEVGQTHTAAIQIQNLHLALRLDLNRFICKFVVLDVFLHVVIHVFL